MPDIAILENDLYEDLFDVNNEADNIGNVADFDFNVAMNDLRDKGSVQKGSLDSLLGIDRASKYDKDLPTYTAFSFSACELAFRENETFTSYAYNDVPAIRRLGSVLLNKVGSPHRNLRKTVQPLFIKPAAAGWWNTNWIDETVTTLIDRLRDARRIDLNREFCARLPLVVVTRAVGLESQQALIFRKALLQTVGLHRANPEERAGAVRVVDEILRDVITERRKSGREDVISRLITADFQDGDNIRKLDDDEIVGFSKHLLLAGGGTTWRQLGITLHAMLSHSGVWRACRDDRNLVLPAIEESIRWNATGPVFPRLVLEDVDLEGVRIPAFSRVDICFGAANRDPSRWDAPDTFDIYRQPKVHLGFGLGPHLCMGQHVARQMMSTAIHRLMDEFPNLRLDPDAPAQRLTGGLEQRGMSGIPVILG